jgi:hypothetical protein
MHIMVPIVWLLMGVAVSAVADYAVVVLLVAARVGRDRPRCQGNTPRVAAPVVAHHLAIKACER